MNILFPIAGYGTRFKSKGFNEPKPFVKVKDKYIIEYALSSLKLKGKYYIITRLLEDKYVNILNEIGKKYDLDMEIIDVKRDTSGQSETCYLICDKIDLNEQLIITNCDQYTPWNHEKFINFINTTNFDGVVTTYKHYDVELNKPGRYSYIKLNENGIATELREKFAISNVSLNGIFYWKSGSLFKHAAEKLMSDQVTSERYVSLAYNYIIKDGYKVTNYHMEKEEFVSLGSPEEIEMNFNLL